jgi:hypothetical protein
MGRSQYDENFRFFGLPFLDRRPWKKPVISLNQCLWSCHGLVPVSFEHGRITPRGMYAKGQRLSCYRPRPKYDAAVISRAREIYEVVQPVVSEAQCALLT